ncbi:Methanogenic corrinoid protein MtbC1 [Cognatiyoonia koreensis]|uniref:Methanogenic corrinoid protein MtbC1 n=1 Tax=Cognatiyoonia koreensis TaxID=364200 RepID=A0A1I0PQT9_9RHOB|nr:cobalamin-binding protein [Cognatiyoonia koreensis]SEW16768.1 Methanogenic corrinoid protein MtbC1 [Cognatiyoonia koreensis]
MAKGLLSENEIDRQAYALAERQFALVQEVLPVSAVETLAQEVVRRLAFRMPRSAMIDSMPSQQEVDRLCAALLSTEEVAGDRIILAARRDGASAEIIYLGYVAGAARKLGTMWEEDRVSFVEVTLATSRLYRIIRGLRHILDSASLHGAAERHVLFALVPGDTHTLGIEMATDLFRRDDWDAELSVGETHDEVVARTERDRFQSVVLVAHSERSLPNLISLVLALRITQPLAHLVVAGNIVDLREDVGTLVGADDVIPEIQSAVERLRAIIAADK